MINTENGGIMMNTWEQRFNDEYLRMEVYGWITENGGLIVNT